MANSLTVTNLPLPALRPRAKTYIEEIEIPSEIREVLKAEATAYGKSITEVVIDRLRRCIDHAAKRPIYFNDVERNELEHLLGGHLLNTAQHVLVRLRQALALSIGGARVQLTESQVSRIQSRGRRDRSTEDNVKVLVTKLIERYLRGEL